MALESITTGAITFVRSFANWNPLVSLLIFSLIVTLLSTLAYKFLTNQKEMKEAKEELKKMQSEMKLVKDDPSQMLEKQKQMWEKNLVLMKNSFKPVIYTFIPFLLVFFLLRESFEPLGKIAFGLSWFWIYLISSLVFNILLRKILKVY